MNEVVKAHKLSKTYGDMKALDDVSLTIEANKIYGLLGRNGAGKTTLMHILTAQNFATSGEIKVFGEHPYENNRVLSQICFIKESQRYPDSFRVAHVLDAARLLFPNWDQQFAATLLEDFQLPVKRRMKKLSRGMLSAVGIIVGLASRAPLTIFDEPYLGLDAVSRSLFYDRLLEDYAEYPRTVILSTHLIDEVSQLLEHVMVIDRGKLIINEEAETLRGRATTITGPSAKVEAFAKGRQVIHREPLGGMMQATILGVLTERDQQSVREAGMDLTPVSLQQMIVHMTNGKWNRKAEIAE
jgi:ABC-2 type transport system ATP-binding protein